MDDNRIKQRIIEHLEEIGITSFSFSFKLPGREGSGHICENWGDDRGIKTEARTDINRPAHSVN